VVISDFLRLGRVLLHRQVHGAVQWEPDDARILVNPSIAGGLLSFLGTQLGEGGGTLCRRVNAIADERTGILRHVEIVHDREEEAEEYEDRENAHERSTM
jgi:hypothetical protein